MATGPWGATLRVAAAIAGVVLPMTAIAIARADLPGLPSPPVGGLPQGGQPITVVIELPGLGTTGLPIPLDNCSIALSYDNTGTLPPGTVFRGETACGPELYEPTISGHATLTDIFGNVVGDAPGFGGVGNGPFTSQGSYLDRPGVGAITSPSTYGAGPVPGMEYTINYTTTIALPAQFWTAAGPSCEILGGGRVMRCSTALTYIYVPGTAGGATPA